MTVSKSIRRMLSERAGGRCEYCLIHEDISIKKHEPDHIIPKKHGGSDDVSNLALACFVCNKFKGSEVGAFDSVTGELVAIFNPRFQSWDTHFELSDGLINPLTDVGRVSILVLQLNRPLRVQLRKQLFDANLYP